MFTKRALVDFRKVQYAFNNLYKNKNNFNRVIFFSVKDFASKSIILFY